MEQGQVLLDAASPELAEAIAAMEAYAPTLLAVARVISLNDDDAADLVQTTFEIALRTIVNLRDPAAMRLWLLRIQSREAFRLTRRLRRFVRFNAALHDRAMPSIDLAEHIDVRDAISSLPPRVRAAIALHHLVGLSVSETAHALGVSSNTTKTQLKAGLARLRERLDDE